MNRTGTAPFASSMTSGNISAVKVSHEQDHIPVPAWIDLGIR